ncbi:hypothetical protein DAPPUDRAFT_314648 [Daphnia pulex]|uniref:tRNA-guanine(15) transglycosylase-like domain-containing protein n=2 Tax=Daphnia pulex TaxID=6669 RepID=E9G707_DAPPU|nr:hypothetical protein DAPPUDRAFT_314645 [Daphnia pulex]EFX84383.1 hypothetical protein DAPPUDRAFT_314648 [Daphnia pulex]|eukprot:EFX84377.1 hypothetical protein DAPPUDRAFT_314645 [Daphnia pulex]
MKFAVYLVAESSARLGSLTEFARIPEAVFETPLLLLHTRGASVPHLSYDLLQMVSTGHYMLQMPLVTLVDHTKNVKAFGKGIAEFAGLKIVDIGYHEKNSISPWTRGGRKLIDPQTYNISCIEALKPDMFQAIVDGDTTQSSSAKRVRKSVDVTVKFAGICADLKEKSDGSLSENLPRAFHGPITPIVLLKLVSKGIDILDGTFPWLVAERGSALVFPNSLSKENAPVTETLPSVKAPAVVATDQKVTKLADDNSNKEAVDRVYEINLKDKIYFSDTRPLLEGCSCYSCRKYSRNYVHHLTATGELQGPILIMMHNFHHYINSFKSIQQAIKDNE